MNVLTQLGVNQTLWIQLVLFLVTYLFLSQFLFKPYLRVIHARKKNTGGAVVEANQISTGAENLAAEYQQKVKQHHDEASSLYQKIRTEGVKQEEAVLTEARARAAE